MSNNLNIQDIVEKNARLDASQLELILKVVQESKRLGITPPGYRLSTPMTPRNRPPIDHDNRVADLQNQARGR